MIAVARDDSGRPLATTALTGPDPYESTASLLAWAPLHPATPDTDLRPGVHGPVAAFGLGTLTQGATESGLHQAQDRSAVEQIFQDGSCAAGACLATEIDVRRHARPAVPKLVCGISRRQSSLSMSP